MVRAQGFLARKGEEIKRGDQGYRGAVRRKKFRPGLRESSPQAVAAPKVKSVFRGKVIVCVIVIYCVNYTFCAAGDRSETRSEERGATLARWRGSGG